MFGCITVSKGVEPFMKEKIFKNVICLVLLIDSVRYFPKIPNRAEPNNTKPKLRYLVKVRFGRTLPSTIVYIMENMNYKWYIFCLS